MRVCVDDLRIIDLGRRPGKGGRQINVRLGAAECERLADIQAQTNLTTSDLVRAMINWCAADDKEVAQ